ncbi:hypothetical protein MLD59_19775, partial [Verrucomicrobiaceae bacterium E54]|nr:hypothetical protein [Verrucomicrobiaceae bacterium E54]
MNSPHPLTPKRFDRRLALAAAVLATTGFAQAASINFVGSQDNIETKNDDQTIGWRNTTPAKTLDIDGDNIIGTDGYRTSNRSSNPSYA